VIDHVGYLVRDLDAAVERVTRELATEVTHPVDRPQWSLFGYYVGQVEVFTFTDPQLLDERLGGADDVLDHIAWQVDDIAAAMARFPEAHWTGPDLRETVTEAFDLGTAKHIWTISEGLGLQLIEHARPV